MPIADVARMAGVSRTTVSHVLSGKRTVSPETTDRVLTAMRSLGYVPSRTAQNLARGSTQTLGILVPDLSNAFFADLVRGGEQAAIERGFNVLLGSTGWNLEREIFYLGTLRSRAVDGVVYATGAPDVESKLAEFLVGLPSVAVDEELDAPALATVVSDNARGGELVAEHLAHLGHSRVAVVGSIPRLASSANRVEGFTREWKRLTGAQPLVIEGAFDEFSGYEAARGLESAIRGGDLTGVFALNDLIALGVLRRLREVGVSVPVDCSVVGFDDIPTARHTSPALTTVRQDPVNMGAVAVNRLLDHLLGLPTPEPGRQVLPVELVVRESAAPRCR